MSTELKKGDIIIFKAEEDRLSKVIAWLTNSDVSHAAMAYSKNSIIEVGANGIGIHNVDISSGRGAYIMRLQPEVEAPPLIQSADKYFQAKIRYDFPALFLLAGLLVQKKINPTTRLISIINRILASVCLELDKYIQKAILHHEERAMVCSQLIYQIFFDCGGTYQIQINPSKNEALSAANEKMSVCLWEMAEELPTENEFYSNALLPEDQTLESNQPVDDLDIEELYLALCKSEDAAQTTNDSLLNAIPDLHKSTHYARIFMDHTKHIISLLGSDIPMDALFITPADLAYHAGNLKKQGVIGLTRVSVH